MNSDRPRQTFVLPPLETLYDACPLLSRDEMLEFAREAWVKAGGAADVRVVFSEMVSPEEGGE